MIIVTVGMQLGFDRLIEAMDALAPDLGHDIIAQTGKGTYTPKHMESREKIAAGEFEKLVEQCDLIVSHAGIGTVLTAQRYKKPIVLVPRRHSLGEHRNDHQVATARHLGGRSGIIVAMEDEDLAPAIAEGLAMDEADPTRSPSAQSLHQALGNFIETGQL